MPHKRHRIGMTEPIEDIVHRVLNARARMMQHARRNRDKPCELVAIWNMHAGFKNQIRAHRNLLKQYRQACRTWFSRSKCNAKASSDLTLWYLALLTSFPPQTKEIPEMW